MARIEGVNKIEGALATGRIQVAYGLYDFAVDGGAVGTLALRGDSVIPSGASILAAMIHVDTVPTSGGAATIGVSSEGASDLRAAAAISGAPWSSTGDKWGSQTFTTAPITTTAARTISAVIGTAALTAGKFAVAVFYIVLV